MQQNNQIPNDLTLESISKEQVLDLLKEKGREFQKLQKKLGAVQEKYVQIFKEQKLILKDKSVLEKTLYFFLNEDPYLFEPKQENGLYDQSELLELCKKREDEKQKTLTEMIAATNKEKFQDEQKYKQMSERQISGSDDKTQMIIKQFKQQIHDLESNNTKLAREIIELNDILQFKNIESDHLKAVEEEYANYKTQMMMQDMEQQSQTISNQQDPEKRYYKSDKINQQLQLQNRIEKLVDENKQLKVKLDQYMTEYDLQNQKYISETEKQISKKNKESSASLNKSEHNSAKILSDYDFNPFEGEINQKSWHQIQKNSLISSYSQTVSEQQMHEIDLSINQSIEGQIQVINNQYLKNVIFKYFLYNETKNVKEAAILRHAIMTILKMSKEQMLMIEEAKNRSTMWSYAKSYISESVFCYKQGLNLNEIQTQDRPIQQENSLSQSLNTSMNMK